MIIDFVSWLTQLALDSLHRLRYQHKPIWIRSAWHWPHNKPTYCSECWQESIRRGLPE